MKEDASALTVAIVGFGTVGQSVARIMRDGGHSSLRLTHICNRQIERKRVDWVSSSVVWTENYSDILAADVDVVVETIGGLHPAKDWIQQALAAEKSVVTANKQVIAHHGPELAEVAARTRQSLRFEAAVAGGIPIIHGLQVGLAGDSLFRVLGILNGTCNYILTRMEIDGVSFAAALEEAQSLGFAEADPSADVDGSDAQAKLAILAAVGLGRPVEVAKIPLRSIRTVEAVDFVYAARLGCTIRQVSRVEALSGSSDVLASVQPALVSRGSMLARVEGSQNVVIVEGRFGGETAFSGYGAGGDPTACSVVADLEAIARGGPTASPPRAGNTVPSATPSSVVSHFVAPHYVRCVVADRPGIIAALAVVFSNHKINIDSVLQEPGWDKHELPTVITLESCDSAVVERAVQELAAFDFHVRPPLWMPVLATGDTGR